MASGLFMLALLLVASCKEKPGSAPAAVGSSGPSGSGDAAMPAPPVDAANLPTVTPAERAMVTKWFARLNGTGKLEIKGIDVEPFRKQHLGQMVDAGTTIAWAVVPTDGKRTFVVTGIAVGAGKRGEERVYMTFDAQDALVGISY